MREFDWAAMWTPKLPPWEVSLRAALVYLFIQFVLRLMGRKQLGRHSTPDMVLVFLVTVAVRETMVADDRSLTSAFVAFSTLALLDWLQDFVAVRSKRVAKLLYGPPHRIAQDGQLLEAELRKARLSHGEFFAHLRAKGTEDLSRVREAFIEPDGQITILFREGSKSS